jgi:ATP-dependent DNA ligase
VVLIRRKEVTATTKNHPVSTKQREENPEKEDREADIQERVTTRGLVRTSFPTVHADRTIDLVNQRRGHEEQKKEKILVPKKELQPDLTKRAKEESLDRVTDQPAAHERPMKEKSLAQKKDQPKPTKNLLAGVLL